MITTTNERNRKAWELVQRLVETVGSPVIFHKRGDYCLFCGELLANLHAPDCIWLEARRLVEGDE